MWYNHTMCDTELTTEKILQSLPGPLLAWYRENARDLPWRRTADPYRIWVSEIMLQQTRVAAVLGYYARFLDAFPSVEALASAPEERLMKLWEGLGYYSRARNLRKAAQIVAEKGAFPDTFQGLLALPGIGEYTAGAIASAAFGAREAAVDGNVLRIYTRLTDCHDDAADPGVKRAVRDRLQAVMPEREADIRIFNQATMELGATVCVPNGAPKCGDCPAAHLCLGRMRGTAEILPVKRAQKGAAGGGQDRLSVAAAGPGGPAEAPRHGAAGGPLGVSQHGGRSGRRCRRGVGVRLGPDAQNLAQPPDGKAHLHPRGVAHDRLRPGKRPETAPPRLGSGWNGAGLAARAVPSAFARYYTRAVSCWARRNQRMNTAAVRPGKERAPWACW